MPITRMLSKGKFKPVGIEKLKLAFAHTLSSLQPAYPNDDPLCETVARRIEVDTTGIHDPLEISKIAVRELGLPENVSPPVRSPGAADGRHRAAARAHLGAWRRIRHPIAFLKMRLDLGFGQILVALSFC